MPPVFLPIRSIVCFEGSSLPSRDSIGGLLLKRGVYCSGQCLESGSNVGTQVNAQGTASSGLEHGEIAGGLGIDDCAKGEPLIWDWQIDGVIGGDLEEDAGVGSTFVVLAGGVEEARAKAQASGYAQGIANPVADALNRRLVFRKHGEIGEEGEVGQVCFSTCFDPGIRYRSIGRKAAEDRGMKRIEMCSQDADQRLVWRSCF